MVLILLSNLAPAACGGSRTVVLGEEVDPAAVTPIRSILEDPDEFLGKSVTVRGRIGAVCQEMGCWFLIFDEGRDLYVDLQHGKHFTVPKDSGGRWAVVTGPVQADASGLRIIGRGVRIEASP